MYPSFSLRRASLRNYHTGWHRSHHSPAQTYFVLCFFNLQGFIQPFNHEPLSSHFKCHFLCCPSLCHGVCKCLFPISHLSPLTSLRAYWTYKILAEHDTSSPGLEAYQSVPCLAAGVPGVWLPLRGGRAQSVCLFVFLVF